MLTSILKKDMQYLENFIESAQSRAYTRGRVTGGTRYAATGTAAQVDATGVPRHDAIDDIPFVLRLYIKMLLHQSSQARRAA